MQSAKVAGKPRPWYWLAAKGDRPSKTAFWLFLVMGITCAMLVVVAVRLATIADDQFVMALGAAAPFYGFMTWLITRLYHNGKDGPPPAPMG